MKINCIFLSPLLSFGKTYKTIALIALFITVAFIVSHNDAKNHKIRADITLFSLNAGRVYFAGGNPYNRAEVGRLYKYFPTNFLVLKPLTYFNNYQAQGIWVAFNTVLIFCAFFSIRNLVGPYKIPRWVTVFALACAFRLIITNLRLGQWNTSVFCLSIIGLEQIHKNRLLRGGILIGLAGTLKFMPIFFIPYLLLRRHWKAASYVTAGTIFWMFVFPVITLGPTEAYDLAQKALKTANRRVESITTGEVVGSISVHSTIYRLLTPAYMELDNEYYRSNIVNLSRESASTLAKIFSIALFIGVSVYIYRNARRIPLTPLPANLALLGSWYTLWYIIMPGIRPAQTISILPACFVIGMAAALTSGTVRRVFLSGCVITFFLLISTSEFKRHTTYQNYLLAGGIHGLALLVILGFNLYAVKLLCDPSRSGDLNMIPIRGEDSLSHT